MWLLSITMVIHRSEFSRSRTSIHGGLRRGAAAAAVGAVLVLSAGVSASQAADDNSDPRKSVEVATGTDQPKGKSRLKGLLSGSAGDANLRIASEPTPTAPSVSDAGAKLSTAAPTATQPQSTINPAPTPAAPLSPVPSSAAPLQPAPSSAAPSAPAQSAPAPSSGPTALGTDRQGAAAEAVEPSATPAPVTTPPAPGGSPTTGGASGQPGAPTAPTDDNNGTQNPGDNGGSGENQPSTESRHSATPVSNPNRSGSVTSGQQKASASEAEPVVESAKILLGVGLVGSAGAAGLLFYRIRKF